MIRKISKINKTRMALAGLLIAVCTVSGFAHDSGPARYGRGRVHAAGYRSYNDRNHSFERTARKRFQRGYAAGHSKGESAGYHDALNGWGSAPWPHIKFKNRTVAYTSGFRKGYAEAYTGAYNEALAKRSRCNRFFFH
jgi:hypothetical protein